MKLYIAGPMSGLPDFNYPEFYACEDALRERGYEPVNPARLFGGTAERTREEYMRAGLALLLEADGIVLLDNWKDSPGATLEHDVAHQCGMLFGRWSRDLGLTLYL